MHVQTPKTKHFTVPSRNFKDFDGTIFSNDILSAQSATIKRFGDIGDILEACLDLFLQVVDQHTSIKQQSKTLKHL